MSEEVKRPTSHADWVHLVETGEVKLVQFTPEDSVPIGINGCTYYVERGKETELPQPFYEVYRQSRQMQMEAVKNSRASLDKRAFGAGQTSLDSGWNGNSA